MRSERERYLQRAKEARQLAETADPALRADFLSIAENWEMLARHQDERARAKAAGRE